ncbi:MAG TPA: helix-turn-helix domain-containing protein [Ideonella sp.]|nr:helix-turn-helix domain-containing protein [Ideonella sp.]
MVKKAASPSIADRHAAPGGAAAVDRALSLLGCFRSGDVSLSLTELAQRSQLYKSTALRLLASLEHARLLLRLADGRYALGPTVARLHAIYTASFSLEATVLPALRALVERTQESAAFHVRQAEQRLCLYRVDSAQVIRDHTKAGDLLPLERGAGGRVLMAFSGAQGEPYERIRRERVFAASGDRTPELSGISSPVFSAAGELVGAVTLTMPTERLNPAHAPEVLATAAGITRALGGA